MLQHVDHLVNLGHGHVDHDDAHRVVGDRLLKGAVRHAALAHGFHYDTFPINDYGNP